MAAKDPAAHSPIVYGRRTGPVKVTRPEIPQIRGFPHVWTTLWRNRASLLVLIAGKPCIHGKIRKCQGGGKKGV